MNLKLCSLPSSVIEARMCDGLAGLNNIDKLTRGSFVNIYGDLKGREGTRKVKIGLDDDRSIDSFINFSDVSSLLSLHLARSLSVEVINVNCQI